MRGNHAGDWNKDGLDSVGVYRINAVYLTNRTDSGAGSLDVAYNYGSVGDIAIAGKWRYVEPVVQVCSTRSEEPNEQTVASPDSEPVLRAEYYDDPNLSEFLTIKYGCSTVDKVWSSTDTPATNINPGTFSVRWTGWVAQSSGAYRIIAEVEGGIRVKLNGITVIDNWAWHNGLDEGSFTFPGSDYYVPIVIEYTTQQSNSGKIKLFWERLEPYALRELMHRFLPPEVPTRATTATSGLYVQFMPIQSGQQPASVVTSVDKRGISHKWRDSAPALNIPADNFTATWSGQLEPPQTATYTFYLVADEWARLTIHAQETHKVVSQGQPVSMTLALTAGQRYELFVEYYDTVGDATIQVQWEAEQLPRQPIYTYWLTPDLPDGQTRPFPIPTTPTVRRVIPLTRDILAQVLRNAGKIQGTGIQFNRALGRFFENFALKQFAFPGNGMPYISQVRSQAAGSQRSLVKPDGVDNVYRLIMDPQTGNIDVELYPQSIFMEVKSISCDYLRSSYFHYQLLGEVHITQISPLGVANIFGGPPALLLATTANTQPDVSLITEASNRNVALFHAIPYIFVDENDVPITPVLIFFGGFQRVNAPLPDTSEYLTIPPLSRGYMGIFYTLDAIEVLPVDPTDPDFEDEDDSEVCQ